MSRHNDSTSGRWPKHADVGELVNVDAAADAGGEVRVRAVVTGMVQGVGYRYFTVNAASRLGVAGWVRNRRDGSVEVEAQGDAEAVSALVKTLNDGPRWGHVDHVAVRGEAVRNLPSSSPRRRFEVRADV
ncbi:acylphosphatase [Bifidobacterium sp. ESL0763]|uniref:acylphosphatase n=1 Tax=Bifidobacterium sp. ESL0763 TaxID=2983227 RepID=UPI0023F7340A|nr:acylphosphatase [Bifidobacterium sp. ESL0763]MDF7663282.1 acylphosphatase [Bifidobacterium sp. ESL0763]